MNKTKSAIFKAAIKVFSSYGYTGATMDEIVNCAGVSKGSLYYHFKSKEELFNFIIDEGINLIIENVDEATKNIDNPLERLEISARVQLKYAYERKDLIKVIMSQLWGSEERNEIIRSKVKVLLNKANENLEDAMNKGNIEKRDSIFLSYSFLGMVFSSALYELLNEDESNYDESIEKFMINLKYGIVGKSSTL